MQTQLSLPIVLQAHPPFSVRCPCPACPDPALASAAPCRCPADEAPAPSVAVSVTFCEPTGRVPLSACCCCLVPTWLVAAAAGLLAVLPTCWLLHSRAGKGGQAKIRGLPFHAAFGLPPASSKLLHCFQRRSLRLGNSRCCAAGLAIIPAFLWLTSCATQLSSCLS